MRGKLLLRRWCALALGASLFAGCEGGDGGSSHDFGDNDPNVVVCMGDSITEGYLVAAADSYPAQLAGIIGKTVHNRGVGGARSSYGASTIDGVLSRYKPGYVLILFGANDVIHGGDQDEVISNLRGMVQRAKDNKTVPVIGTLTPMYAGHSTFNSGAIGLSVRIRAMAAEEGVDVADLEAAFGADESLLLSDGLHPNAASAKVIAETFAGYIN